MWPSTGPGDISGRSLGADDIQGACEVYPSGGEVPEPDPDGPPPPGDLEFGEDCSMGRCAAALFCVSDGRDSYCSRECSPGDDSCGAGYYCAQLSQGGGACARGEDPAENLGGFGEECGAEIGCQPGLVCINDEGNFYCTGECVDGDCPEAYFCTELQNGQNLCVRGDGVAPGELPGAGQACTERGLCERGFFCLNDSTNIDEATGEVVPYCTNACDAGQCEDGYRCVDVAPSGTACQLIPSAGMREIGQDCWVNPEAPWEVPICSSGLVCVGYHIDENQMVDDRGICTRNCDASDCCPEGWGCLEITPVFGQCGEGVSDSPSMVCMGERPDPGMGGAGGDSVPDGGAGGAGGDGEGPSGDGGGAGGCATSTPGGELPFALFALLALGRRRRREP
jgi:MYXO-CTERM domain-containing protein